MTRRYKNRRYQEHEQAVTGRQTLLGFTCKHVPAKSEHDWSNAQDDQLLNELAGMSDVEFARAVRRGPATVCGRLGRSHDSVWSRVRKLAIRHRQSAGYQCADYEPRMRTARTGAPWSSFDRYIALLAFGSGGRKYGADDVHWLAKLLARDAGDVDKNLREHHGRR